MPGGERPATCDRVPVRRVAGAELECHPLALPGLQAHLLEALELARRITGRSRQGQVQLDDVRPGALPGVLDGHTGNERATRVESRTGAQPGEPECRIGQ